MPVRHHIPYSISYAGVEPWANVNTSAYLEHDRTEKPSVSVLNISGNHNG